MDLLEDMRNARATGALVERLKSEEGRLLFDDPAHMTQDSAHIHIDRAAGTHPHDE